MSDPRAGAVCYKGKRRSDMTPLAVEIYKILKAQALLGHPNDIITYADLSQKLSQPIHHRSPDLFAALGDIVDDARARGIPALAALVINKDQYMPGMTYYEVAHPNSWDSSVDDDKQNWPLLCIAWGHEVLAIRNYARKPGFPGYP